MTLKAEKPHSKIHTPKGRSIPFLSFHKTALFFEHSTYHIGDVVTRGRKYVLRTDVMYASDEDDQYSYAYNDSDDDEW